MTDEGQNSWLHLRKLKQTCMTEVLVEVVVKDPHELETASTFCQLLTVFAS